ncbi:MAG TPA: hypothetical protein PKE29_07450 [Phycisphaerales bacterium]|nr:hypothetical protein [Phycisphaerales bacterium]
MRFLAFAIAGGIGAMLAAPARGIIVTLDMGTLPSANGFAFVPTGFGASPPTEAGVFSLAGGGLLHQTTIGTGSQAGGSSIYYTRSITPDWAQSYLIEARLRLDQSEFFGSYQGMLFGTSQVWVGINADRFTLPTTGGTTTGAFDSTDGFHVYRFDVQVNHSWTFSIDGVQRGTGNSGIGSGSTNLRLGDGSGGSNAAGYYDYVNFTQPIPSPGCVAPALVMLAAGWRRRG